MKPQAFTLDFRANDDCVGIASAQVAVMHSTQNDKGMPVLLMKAAGPSELDAYIDVLQKELEEIRKRGHRKFEQQKQRWHDYIEAKRRSDADPD